jgi:hypothetical protein
MLEDSKEIERQGFALPLYFFRAMELMSID